VSDLELDDVDRDALARESDRVGVAQLIGREPSGRAGRRGELTQLGQRRRPGQSGTHDRPSLSRLTPVANLNRQRVSFCFGPRPTRSEGLARHTTALIKPERGSVG
jgi:hypothetical protein